MLKVRGACQGQIYRELSTLVDMLKRLAAMERE
jgi:hypothetical protein